MPKAKRQLRHVSRGYDPLPKNVQINIDYNLNFVFES